MVRMHEKRERTDMMGKSNYILRLANLAKISSIGFLCLTLGLSGCRYYNTVATDDGGDGKGTREDAGTDAGPDFGPDFGTDMGADFSSDGDGEIECTYGAPFVRQFDKSCNAVEDCAIVWIAADCCGTPLAAGINQSEEKRFIEILIVSLINVNASHAPSMRKMEGISLLDQIQ